MTDSSPLRPSAWVPGGHVLPAGEEPDEIGQADRFDLPPAMAPAGGVETHQHVAGAPPSVGQLDGRAHRLQPGQAGAGPGPGHRCAPDRAGR